MRQLPLSRTARVDRAARSLPDPGSLNSCAQISSPRSSGGRNRALCSSVPWPMIVGPHMPTPIKPISPGTSARAISWLAITCCIGVPPWPPYSFGHWMPTNPPS